MEVIPPKGSGVGYLFGLVAGVIFVRPLVIGVTIMEKC